jgi:membrane-associated HD superfamily phosphohydrolase
MIEFSWGGLAHYNLLLHTLTPLNAYTFWFLIMVLLIFPFFMIDYPINEKEKKQTKIVYFVLWLMLISLFFIGGPY